MTTPFGSSRFRAAMRTTGATRLEVSGIRGSFFCHALIADGGQGSVYLATGDLLAKSRLCVIKTFKDSDRETVDRARRSIDAQLRLVDTPPRFGGLPRPPGCIPEVLAWSLADPLGPWIAQDFRGASLRRYLWEAARSAAVSDGDDSGLGQERLMGLLSDLARAVDLVHRQRVVHRDLKPENVLVESWLGRPRVILCDFDLARGLDQTTMTQTGARMGTPGYSAPEQMLGLARATEASDVYSVGMLAVFLLAGKEPWDAMTGQDLTRLRLDPETGAVLGETRDWVEAALSFMPEDRPSIGDLLTILPRWTNRPRRR